MTGFVCRCSCGHTGYKVSGAPRLRMICHCTICQKFNEASYADILVFNAAQIKTPAESVVAFSTYKKPPNVQRGRCIKCNQAVIEVFNMPVFPKLTMVPIAMFSAAAQLPKPDGHMFYDKRTTDVVDELPKYQGFMSSQLAFFRFLWFSSKKRD